MYPKNGNFNLNPISGAEQLTYASPFIPQKFISREGVAIDGKALVDNTSISISYEKDATIVANHRIIVGNPSPFCRESQHQFRSWTDDGHDAVFLSFRLRTSHYCCGALEFGSLGIDRHVNIPTKPGDDPVWDWIKSTFDSCHGISGSWGVGLLQAISVGGIPRVADFFSWLGFEKVMTFINPNSGNNLISWNKKVNQ